jgi:hypothetical protein
MSDIRALVPEVEPFQEKTAFMRFMGRVGQLRPITWFMLHVGTQAVLWPKANALYPGYDGYQELAGDREIPVVICSPRN